MRAKNSILVLSLLASACGHSHSHSHGSTHVEPPRLVSILVEVYDPVSNFVWENVSVRIVEADQEWSQCTCTSPYEDWLLTDATGRVYFDEYALAAARVGFLQDLDGRAILGSASHEDQATVVLEIDALGFSPVIVEVPLSWDVPDVFVEVPFD